MTPHPADLAAVRAETTPRLMAIAAAVATTTSKLDLKGTRK
jgi:hypothetical protein